MDDEEPAIELLIDISSVIFFYFPQVNEDVAVSGLLTDGEILSATSTNVESNDEGEAIYQNLWQRCRLRKQNSRSIPYKPSVYKTLSDEKAFQALILLEKLLSSLSSSNVLWGKPV